MENSMFHALQEEGIKVIDGQKYISRKRDKKLGRNTLTEPDMVDGVYHMIYEELKPGVGKTTLCLSNKMLYEMGLTT